MPAAAPPLRWLIGRELESHRRAARLTLDDAAAAAKVSRNKVNNMERGIQGQDPEDIAVLLRAYGVPDRAIDRLTALTARADEAMWWAPWRRVVPDWLRTMVGLEGLAESVFTFQPLNIPGLLQTQGYAAAVTASARSIRPDHGERFVGFRMARTRRLTDTERPLSFHAVITESALRLAVGTPEVRYEQLQHLIAMADRSNVTIQVVRPEDGPHPALSGNFVSFDFGAAARPVVYVELKDGAVYLQDEDDVDAYSMAASDVQRVAMSPEQSRELIASMLEHWQGRRTP